MKFSGSRVCSSLKKDLQLKTGKQYQVRFTIDMGNCTELHFPIYKSDISSYVTLTGVISGDGNQYDYGFRIYNPRIGRFLSTDPLWLFSAQFKNTSSVKNHPLSPLPGCQAGSLLTGFTTNFKTLTVDFLKSTS